MSREGWRMTLTDYKIGEQHIRQSFAELPVGAEVTLKIANSHHTDTCNAEVAFFTRKLIGFKMPHGIETFQKKQIYHGIGVKMKIK